MVNTVLGPIPADSIGKTLMHEHFVFGYPGFDGDCTLGGFDRGEALRIGIEAAERMKAFNVKTVIDCTPNECGRNPELYREISERTGLQIICATGYYFEGEGAPPYFRRWIRLGDGVSAIFEMFMKEIEDGIAKTGIKPGVIKLGTSQGVITDYERAFFKAAARVQKETGITIITHTQVGTMGPEQAELLLSEGADPNRVVIGHMCGNTDMAYHLRTLRYGVSIAFDRFGLQGLVGAPMDELREACLIGLIGLGYGKKLLLSHDKIVYRLGRRQQPMPENTDSLLANWHVTHIFENVVPVLRNAGITEQQINDLFDSNVRSVFGG